MGKITVLSRRKVTDLPEHYGVDLAAEETGGRLVQHIEGLTPIAICTLQWVVVILILLCPRPGCSQ